MKLEIDFVDALPRRVSFAGQLIGQEWGVETADRGSFFTLTEGGCCFTIISDRVVSEPQYALRTLEVRMAEGHWRLRLETVVSQSSLTFRSQLKALEDSWFQDFVNRYRFESRVFDQARIAGRDLHHVSSNRWYQFPVNRVELFGEDVSATVQVTKYHTAGRFRQEAYVRDEPLGNWVVHGRFIPHPPEALWIRWDTRFGRVVDLRGVWARWLLAARGMRSWLWYRAERVGGHPNFQAQGLARLRAGESIMMETVASFSTGRGQL